VESDGAMLEMLPGLVRIYEEWAERHPDVQPLTIQFAPDGEPANGDMTSLVIVPDTEIRAMDTPNGIVLFLQLVGLLAEEGEALQRAGTAAPLVALLRDRDPRMITDPSREPVRL
jgi:hypothetical protein